MKLTLALRAGPLAQALMSGRAQPEGIALAVLTPPVEELFGGMLRDGAYDVAEMSLSSFVSARTRFNGLPVFPLRRSVHGCVHVSTRSGIRRPSELAGSCDLRSRRCRCMRWPRSTPTAPSMR